MHDARVDAVLFHVHLERDIVGEAQLWEIDEIPMADYLVWIMGKAEEDWGRPFTNCLLLHFKFDDYAWKTWNHQVFLKVVVADWSISFHQPQAHILICFHIDLEVPRPSRYVKGFREVGHARSVDAWGDVLSDLRHPEGCTNTCLPCRSSHLLFGYRFSVSITHEVVLWFQLFNIDIFIQAASTAVYYLAQFLLNECLLWCHLLALPRWRILLRFRLRIWRLFAVVSWMFRELAVDEVTEVLLRRIWLGHELFHLLNLLGIKGHGVLYL